MLTPEVMKRCLPAKYKGRLTDENVANINKAFEDDEFRDAIKENILGFSTVLNSPNYSIEEYINAVKYITYTSTTLKWVFLNITICFPHYNFITHYIPCSIWLIVFSFALSKSLT